MRLDAPYLGVLLQDTYGLMQLTSVFGVYSLGHPCCGVLQPRGRVDAGTWHGGETPAAVCVCVALSVRVCVCVHAYVHPIH